MTQQKQRWVFTNGDHKVHLANYRCQEREVWVCSEDESIGACLDKTQIPWFSDPRQFPEIRGADIITQNRIKVSPDQPLDFHWEDYGFQIHIPAGAFRRPVTLCIQASLRGDYQLPNDDDKIDSGVFCLSLQPLVERVDKKVTLMLPLIVIQIPLLLLPSKQKTHHHISFSNCKESPSPKLVMVQYISVVLERVGDMLSVYTTSLKI